MIAQTLPDESNFCFVPADDVETDVPQFRIMSENPAGHVPTALIALNVEDALNICNQFNRCLGHDREVWTAMVATSMPSGDDGPEGGAWH